MASVVIPGGTSVAEATQSEMETGSSNSVFVSPANIKHARGSAKAWVSFNGTGTPAIIDSYGVSSITDNGTGDYTVNFGTAFSSANFACMGIVRPNSDVGGYIQYKSTNSSHKTTTSVNITTHSNGVQADVTIIDLIAYGDQ